MMEDDRMDAENRRLTDNLARDIRQLKSLAYDIEDEAKEHNRYVTPFIGFRFISFSLNRTEKIALGTVRARCKQF